MTSRSTFLCAAIAMVTGVMVLGSIPSADADHHSGEPKAEVVEDSMHEFMEYVFQPAYRRLKSSMASEPSDNGGWKAIKSDSLILAESCNLLFARTPDKDGSDWNKHSASSRTEGAKMYRAARSKDFAATTEAWKHMLDNCNACHRQFEDGKHILKP